jgi:hypothetical protein
MITQYNELVVGFPWHEAEQPVCGHENFPNREEMSGVSTAMVAV